MAGDLLLVGSIPLDTPEQVFRRIGGPLGPYLACMPDGEVGDRRYWIDGIDYRVFNGHPEIETLRRPAPDANGVESWRPLGVHDQFQFRIKPGVAQVRFGDPGWRLGYTKDAVSSHFVFRQLRAVRIARSIMTAPAMTPFQMSELAPGADLTTDDEILDWVKEAAETTYHPAGTCKMGSDPMAVVDDQLRVHSIVGLRVADASIMPTLTLGNTNAPSIMIGEKAADKVLSTGT